MAATCTRTPLGGVDPGGLAAELLAGEQQAPGNHAVVEGAARAVDVGEERLKHLDPLADPFGYEIPFGRVDGPGGTRSVGTAR